MIHTRYESTISQFSRQRPAIFSIAFLVSVLVGLVGCSTPEKSAAQLLDDALDACRTACEAWYECPGFNPDLNECIERECEAASDDWVDYGEDCLRKLEAYYTCMSDRPCESTLPEDVCIKEFNAWSEACSDGSGTPKND